MQNNRASMFMPYKAINGFEEYVRNKELVKIEDKELFEDVLVELEYQIKSIQDGNIVTILYKDEDYLSITGKVSHINLQTKSIQIVKKVIPFKNIIKIDEIYSSIK